MSSTKRSYVPTDSDSEHEERMKDLKARDEFAQRLQEKDKEKTRNIAVKSDKKGLQEASKRLKLETEDQTLVIPQLRKESRRQYLAKRKDDQLTLLEAAIADEEYLFGKEKLTESEQKRQDYNRKILELARQHDQVSEFANIQRYHIPSEDQTEEYKEVNEGENVPNSEQRKWEEERLGSAMLHFGAKDAKQKNQTKRI
ncbi:putative pre-mRNA-splicing factor ATP-dependent RNA helicase dhx16 [Dermatophagoides farinae]|uniref:Pre-mRNA-splicing factor ATP-dependent RNA helicase dhx16 n=1 Tax=Dermatophagoides farinae TaxID=6954 RepID=A0A922ICD7_DERFA|nr:putative pre-mRNA-splicing factor ATP-dependent RNA helicase dhx16 [Dermatophagoides farinae]